MLLKKQIIIALRRCARIKTFGESSAGHPTTNNVFLRADGAILYFVNKVLVDLSRYEWIDKIHPDIITKNGKSDLVISEAAEWVLKQF